MIQASLTRRANAVQWLIFVVSILIIGGVIGVQLFTEHRSILAEQTERLDAQVRVLNDNILLQIESADRALLDIRRQLAAPDTRAAGEQLQMQLRDFTEVMPGVRTMQVLDANGVVLASNRAEFVGADFSERGYFQMARQGGDTEVLYISPPFKTAAGVWSVNLVRVVPRAGGEFGGIVSVTLDPQAFNVLVSSVIYAPSVWVSIVHGDGIVYLEQPARPDMVGVNVNRPGTMFSRHMASGKRTTFGRERRLGSSDDQLIAVHTVTSDRVTMSTPLVVTMGRGVSATYASWSQRSKVSAAIWLFLAGVGGVGMTFLQAQLRSSDERASVADRELAEISAELSQFFEMSNDLLLLADEEMRVRHANPAWQSVMGYSEPDLIGSHLLDLLHDADLDAVRSDLADLRATEGKGTVRLQGRWRNARGEYRWLQWQVVMFGGKVHAAGRDVTEQCEQEMALRQDNAKLETQRVVLHQQAYLDALTGVANRRSFDERLQAEWRRTRREATPLALVMIDIDHFKPYNDHYGHQAGDRCLQAVAAALTACIQRPYDLMARYGGEEFACILPATDLPGASMIAESLRMSVESLAIPNARSPSGGIVTVSLGLAVLPPGSRQTETELIAAADGCLYCAKHEGRNRFVAIEMPGSA